MKPQNFCDCCGPWHFWHLVFFTSHSKLVNSIPDKVYLYQTNAQSQGFTSITVYPKLPSMFFCFLLIISCISPFSSYFFFDLASVDIFHLPPPSLIAVSFFIHRPKTQLSLVYLYFLLIIYSINSILNTKLF